MANGAQAGACDTLPVRRFSMDTFDQQLSRWREYRSQAKRELRMLESGGRKRVPIRENGNGGAEMPGHLIASLKGDIVFFDRLIAAYEKRRRTRT